MAQLNETKIYILKIIQLDSEWIRYEGRNWWLITQRTKMFFFIIIPRRKLLDIYGNDLIAFDMNLCTYALHSVESLHSNTSEIFTGNKTLHTMDRCRQKQKDPKWRLPQKL